MPITINGTGSITGVTAGGLPSGSVTTANIADANITAAKLNGAQSGSAPIYGARAWVNFNGTSTVAIRASGNVSSITDNGTGDYTVNFTTAMPDADYSPVFGGSGAYGVSVNSNAWFIGMQTASAGGAPITKTTSAVRIACANGGTAITDAPDINVSIFR